MDLFTREDLKTLATFRGAPCISIYMPTNPGGGEQDHIRYRRHLAEAKQRLESSGFRAVAAMLSPANALQDDSEFWKNQCKGLALFLGTDFFRVYRLPQNVVDFETVDSRFCIKPLLPMTTNNGRFFVLALSQGSVRLLQGTREGVHEVNLRTAPKNLADALRTHDRDEPLRYHTQPGGRPGSWTAIYHGQGVGIDTHKDDLRLYFRQINKALRRILRDEHAPLILASVDYLQPIYRDVNTYLHLLDESISGSPDHLSNVQVLEKAWPIVESRLNKNKDTAIALYRQLAGTGRTSADIETVVSAAAAGDIRTLFVANNEAIWGQFDSATGSLVRHPSRNEGDEDLLDLAAAHVLQHNCEVFALDANQIPSQTPVAAVFRLPMAKRGSHRRRHESDGKVTASA